MPRLNTSGLDKIFNRYDGDHDLGPDAPVQWSVYELAYLLHAAVIEIERLQDQVKALQDAVPSARRKP